MIIQEPVQAAIKHALDHYAYIDAIFLAERLYAEVATDDALYLLATCYYRSGKTFSAYSVLHTKGCHTSQCRFLLARCCVDLKKYSEAELALTGCSIAKTKGSDDVASDFSESGAFAVQLLGDVLGKTERYSKAAEAYRKSLRLNPFLWSSYEALVNLGERPDPSKVFSFANIENFSTVQGSNPLINLLNNSNISSSNLPSDLQVKEESSQVTSKVTPTGQSFNIHSPIALLRSSEQSNLEVWTPDNSQWMPVGPTGRAVKSKLVSRVGRGMLSSTTCPAVCTPSFGVLPLMETPSPACGVGSLTDSSLAYITPSPPALIDNLPIEPQAPKKDRINLGLRKAQGVNPPKFQIFSQTSNNSSNTVSQPPSPQTGLTSPGQGNVVRRSSRLFSNSNSVKENNKSSNKSIRFVTSKTATKKSKSRTVKNSSSKESELNELNKPESQENKGLGATAVSVSQAAINMQKASAEGLMNLLQELGKARLYLGQYNCKKAIEVLRSLPSRHFHTGWVLVTLARAHFEQAEYEKSVFFFQEVRQLEPHRLEGMEYYSTALWHIQQEVALSTLAQELTEMAKEAPQTWCVSGNCFSLQKEHETAIKFLQRAVQVEPEFAYAYTLLGHEHVLTEEMDRAMACFRSAIRIDPRHYNAWYGVGMIYYKQEKFHLAEVHFKRALNINPQSSVLMVHIGVVQHALKKTDASLATLNKAMQMDPKNPLCKFHRASIYFSLDRHQEALRELEELKEIVPKESLVFFLIGKVHKKLGNTHLALMNFSWAMDLDPKGANNQIKEAIDKRYTNDEEEVLATSHDPVIDEVAGISLGQADQESSHDSSVMDTEEAQSQAMESDDSF